MEIETLQPDSLYLSALTARWNEGDRPKFFFFWGHSGTGGASYLSQWYPLAFEYEGSHYPTAEHFMMAQKALLFKDEATLQAILLSKTPREAKQFGRSVQNFDEALWKKKRFSIVLQANLAKFSQHSEALDFLKSTAPKILVEASPRDRIWGIGRASRDEKCADPNTWLGLNLLGFALTQVREMLS